MGVTCPPTAESAHAASPQPSALSFRNAIRYSARQYSHLGAEDRVTTFGLAYDRQWLSIESSFVNSAFVVARRDTHARLVPCGTSIMGALGLAAT